MAKIVKNSFSNFFVIFVIFSLVFTWWFSGIPQVWKNPAIPPEIQEARAVDTVEFITDTASTTWTVPSDWDSANNTIELIGGGGGAGGASAGGSAQPSAGGGGGAYAKIINLSLTPLASINIQVGGGGLGDTGSSAGANGSTTYFNGTGQACSGQSVCANGGISGGGAGGTGGAGGATTTSIGTTLYIGGTGADAGASTGGGGGGAAGPNGVGGNAVTTTGGTGGNGSGGAGGTGGKPANPGDNGTEWTTAGSGGGGGGGDGSAANGGNGGNYGGGGGGGDTNNGDGGNGMSGIIVITYTPSAPSVTCTTPLTTTQFGTIDNTAIFSATSSTTTVDCAACTNGFTMKVYGQGSGANPGLWSSPNLIESPNVAYDATTTLQADVDGYGLQATTTSVDINIDPRYNWASSAAVVGGLATSSVTAFVLASSSAAITSQVVTVDYRTAVNVLTPAASGYQDTVTFDCTANP